MPSYAILDSNNVVQNTIYFDSAPDDMAPFIQAHSLMLNKTDLTHVEITAQHKTYNIGHVYDGTEFRPPQPYPSWKWDKEKLMWRPPVVHPDIWPYSVDGTKWGNYTWDEENKKWQPV